MNTILVSYINSISFKVLEDYNFNDNEFKTIFQKIWNTTCDEFGKYKDISDEEIASYKIESDFRIECRNLYTVYFNERKELPEDNYNFIQMLKNNCTNNGLKVAVMDRVSSAKVVE